MLECTQGSVMCMRRHTHTQHGNAHTFSMSTGQACRHAECVGVTMLSVCVPPHAHSAWTAAYSACIDHSAHLNTAYCGTKQARFVTYTHMLQASIAMLNPEVVTASRLPIQCSSCVSQKYSAPMSGTKHRCRTAQTSVEALQCKQAAPVDT